LLGLVIIVINALLVLGARSAVLGWLGLRDVSFMPFRERGARVGMTAQVLTVLAGVMLCYLLDAMLFTASHALGGGPARAPSEIAAVVRPVPDRPAAAAGIREGDRIERVDNTAIATFADLRPALKERSGETVALAVSRGERSLVVEVQVSETGTIGVEALHAREEPSVGGSLAFGLTRPPVAAWAMASGLWRFIVGGVEEELGGPVAIVREAESQPPSSALGQLLGGIASLDAFVGLFAALIFALVVAGTTRRAETSP
jgi:membrane-associated protease RseP (regulator of RpoE activity)